MTVEELLKKVYPEEMAKWDHWDYRIYSPLSLDDIGRVTVLLINKGGPNIQVVLPLNSRLVSVDDGGR